VAIFARPYFRHAIVLRSTTEYEYVATKKEGGNRMINAKRNNLDSATSPYLTLHKNNPIFWQEWSTEILNYAQEHNKLILVSIGYATCQWCKKMSSDAFSDSDTAIFLNENFVSIQVDREQRPDIDAYMMSYAIATQGAAGWPLNIILTPDRKPFLGFTYLPAKVQQGPVFLNVLQEAKTFYESNQKTITPYKPIPMDTPDFPPTDILPFIAMHFDKHNGGFGTMPKFPPHSTLLFLLNYFEVTNDQNVYLIVKKTLDALALRGLHDHLQGGFFRYCTDQSWTTPHFEKMLYDQACLLWAYSTAYKTLKRPYYKQVAEKIMTCLSQTFAGPEGLFYAAQGVADTNNGTPYAWNIQELESLLTPKERDEFLRTYVTVQDPRIGNNFYLLKSRSTSLPEIEKKLLEARLKRPQPFTDKKCITSWNALTAIAYIMAYRCLDNTQALQVATAIFEKLRTTHYDNGMVYHSSIDGVLQKIGFLEDYASMLLLTTYIYEETGNHKELMLELNTAVQKFHKNGWYENLDADLISMPAQLIDQAWPSSNALAHYALWRTTLLTNGTSKPAAFKEPLRHDFFNLYAWGTQGNVYIIDSPEKIDWSLLPVNCIQRRAPQLRCCFANTCKEFKTRDELLNTLRR
jgi:uncharacterized protein YyaL (SSP411 family)